MNNQIMITLNKIKENNPCTDAWKRVLAANGGINADYDAEFPLSSMLDSNNLSDTLWAIECLGNHEIILRKFAVWCARQVSSNTDDKVVLDCLNTIDLYIDGNATDEELFEARSAAWSAVLSAPWSAPWSVAEAVFWAAAESMSWSAAMSAAELAAESDSWVAVDAVARSSAESVSWSTAVSAEWVGVWSKKESAAKLAALSEAESNQIAKLRKMLDGE